MGNPPLVTPFFEMFVVTYGFLNFCHRPLKGIPVHRLCLPRHANCCDSRTYKHFVPFAIYTLK